MQLSDLASDNTKDSFIGCFRELEEVQLNLFLLDSATLNIKREKWVVIVSMVIRVLNTLPVGCPPAIYMQASGTNCNTATAFQRLWKSPLRGLKL